MTRTEPNIVGSYLLYLAGRYAASRSQSQTLRVAQPFVKVGGTCPSPGPMVPAPLVTAELLVSFTIHQHSGVGCLLGFRFVCG